MKYTAYVHNPRPPVIKVETRDMVICDSIGGLEIAEQIAEALNILEGTTPEDREAVKAFLKLRQGMRK